MWQDEESGKYWLHAIKIKLRTQHQPLYSRKKDSVPEELKSEIVRVIWSLSISVGEPS